MNPTTSTSTLPTRAVERDLYCVRCGYNLRTVSVEGGCPECGCSVRETLFKVPHGMLKDIDELVAWLRFEATVRPYEPAARETGFPVDAIKFVRDAIHWAPTYLSEPDCEPGVESAASRAKHIDAPQLCDVIRRYAGHCFEHEARAVFEQWGIGRSEDIGEIVFALVKHGQVTAGESDSPSDFAGLFDLDSFFKQS